MDTWEEEVFGNDANVDFLNELVDLDDDDVIEGVRDACLLAHEQHDEDSDEYQNGLVAATIAAIWAGAPFSAGEAAEEYPFIRSLVGNTPDDQLAEAATALLEAHADDYDVEQFLEALQ